MPRFLKYMLVILLASAVTGLALILKNCSAVTAGANAATRPDAAPLSNRNPESPTADWMRDNLAALGSRTLRQLVLPASHDSAMYLSGFPQSMARTQDLSIYAQLTAGIRFFDLRPRCTDGRIVMHHGPVNGPDLSTVLADVQLFLGQSHRELILLKFSHFDAFDKFAYESAGVQIRQALLPWLYASLPIGKRIADLPLKDYIEHQAVVLVLFDGPYAAENRTPGFWVYRDWDSTDPERGDLRVFDQFADSMSDSAMQADQFEKFDRYTGKCTKRPEVDCDLFLLSWTLTPPTNVPAFAARPNRDLAAALNQNPLSNPSGRMINLLYTDCVSADLTRLAIRQNLRDCGPSAARP